MKDTALEIMLGVSTPNFLLGQIPVLGVEIHYFLLVKNIVCTVYIYYIYILRIVSCGLLTLEYPTTISIFRNPFGFRYTARELVKNPNA